MSPTDPEQFPLVANQKSDIEEPGEEERYRQKMLMENDEWDDQVIVTLLKTSFGT